MPNSKTPSKPPTLFSGVARLCLDDDGAMMAEPSNLETLGDFQLLQKLGTGGMGTVWRAKQPRLKREVAVKVMNSELSSEPLFIQSFQQEAEMIARLQHAGIVPIFSVGEQNGRWFFAMELVDGLTLADLLKEIGHLAPKLAASHLRDVAEAIEHAHQRGVLHCDLKPSNLILEGGVRPRVLDFGLARAADRTASGRTMPALGTPHYAAPEQAKGEPPTAAGDVYSLGGVLYHMLTGRPPFTGSTPLEVLDQAVKEPPVPPRRLFPAIPADLESICLKCLEKEPKRRYASAGALAADLSAFLNNRSVVARPIGLWGRLRRWVKRSPWQAALLLALVLGLASTLWQQHRASLAEKKAEQLAIQSEFERELGLLQNTAAYLDEGNVHQARLALAELPTTGHHGHTWGFPENWLRKQARGQQIAEAEAHADKIWGLAFSPQGTLLATSSEDGHVNLWDTATRARRLSTKFPEGLPGNLIWLSESEVLVAGFHGDAKVLDVASTTWKSKNWSNARFVSVAANGSVLTHSTGSPHYWQAEAEIVVRGVRDEQELLRTAGFKGWPSPDGTLLAVLRGRGAKEKRGQVEIWDIRTRKQTASLPLESTEAALSLAWSPDGQQVVCSVGNQLQAWAWAQPTAAVWATDRVVGVWDVRFSPDGRHVIAAGTDQQLTLHDAATGSIQHSYRGHLNEIWTAAFHPQGNLLASGDKSGHLCWWRPVAALEPLPVHDSYAAPHFAADRKNILTLGEKMHRVELSSRKSTQLAFDGYLLGTTHNGEYIHLGKNLKTVTWSRLADGDVQRKFPLPGELAVNFAQRSPSCFGLGSHEKQLWAWTPDGTALLDTQTVSIQKKLPTAPWSISHIQLSPSGKWLASASYEEIGKARLVEVSTGQEYVLAFPTDSVTRFAFSPDERWLATGGEDACVRFWDLSTTAQPGNLKPTAVLRGHLRHVSSVAFTPDGQFLASAGPGEKIRFWHVPSWRQVLTLPCPPGNGLIALSPDGRWLACDTEVGGKPGPVQLWDAGQAE